MKLTKRMGAIGRIGTVALLGVALLAVPCGGVAYGDSGSSDVLELQPNQGDELGVEGDSGGAGAQLPSIADDKQSGKGTSTEDSESEFPEVPDTNETVDPDAGETTGPDTEDSAGSAGSELPDGTEDVTSTPFLSVEAHVASIGWMPAVAGGEVAGTTGRSLSLEALRIVLQNATEDSGLEIRAHVSGIGWQDWVPAPEFAGTVGRALQIEAVQIRLTGSIASQYDLYYRVHSAGFGWLGWAKNGESAGSQGYMRGAQAIEVVLVRRDANGPSLAPSLPSDGVNGADEAFIEVPTDLSVSAHVSGIGWMPSVSSGFTAGTTGRGLPMEALSIRVTNAKVGGAVELSAYYESTGWQNWSAGSCGTTGKSLGMQAVRLRLNGLLSEAYDLWYRVHVAGFGWLDWTSNGADAGTQGYGSEIQAIEVVLAKKGADAPGVTDRPCVKSQLSFGAHVSAIGWKTGASDDITTPMTIGTTGRGLSLEAFRIALPSLGEGSISYAAHVSGIGWQDAVSDGAISGTTGQYRSVQAVRIALSGNVALSYDVWYRAHVSGYGWLAWTSNGSEAGSQGLSCDLEAIQVVILPKGSSAPGATGTSFLTMPTLEYASYVDGSGWQNSVAAGAVSGTTGMGLSLKGLTAKVNGLVGGGISYRVHVSGQGWLDAASDGVAAGSSDFSKNVEAVSIALSGDIARYYDIWYRVHSEGIGWLGWAKNGEYAGTSKLSLSAQAIQIVIRVKGSSAPGSTKDAFVGTRVQPLAQANFMQRRIVDLARTTPSPGPSLCAMWVSQVFSRAGFAYPGGDARDFYWKWCYSSNLNELKVGMVVAVPSHAHTYAGSIWGHVAIYIGDGMVMDNVGTVRTIPLDWWLSYYATTYQPRWGWVSNVPLC